MKNFFILLASIAMMAFSAQFAAAQDETTAPDSAAVADTAAAEEAIAAEANPFQAAPSEIPLHQQLKTKFIEGGPGFMASIILCLIFGSGYLYRENPLPQPLQDKHQEAPLQN